MDRLLGVPRPPRAVIPVMFRVTVWGVGDAPAGLALTGRGIQLKMNENEKTKSQIKLRRKPYDKEDKNLQGKELSIKEDRETRAVFSANTETLEEQGTLASKPQEMVGQKAEEEAVLLSGQIIPPSQAEEKQERGSTVVREILDEWSTERSPEMNEAGTSAANICMQVSKEGMETPSPIIKDASWGHIGWEEAPSQDISGPIKDPQMVAMEIEAMDSQGTLASLSRLGKRKKPGEGMWIGSREFDSSEEEELVCLRRNKSRSQRSRKIESEDESQSQDENTQPTKQSGKAKISKGINKRDFLKNPDQDEITASGSATDGPTGKGKNIKSGKPPKKKRGVNEPTIEEQLRPVPKLLVKLEDAPTAHSTASAREWLEDIELIRGKSSYQGVLSKRIKERVQALRMVLEVLSVRIEEKGDLEYQKRRNAELRSQLLASQREQARMNRRIDDLQNTIIELRRSITLNERIPQIDKATSPIESTWAGETGMYSVEKENVVMRPPIKGVSTPIPNKGLDNNRNQQRDDAELSRQIVELVAKRKSLRQAKKDAARSRSRSGGRNLPRIVENVQIVPPRTTQNAQEDMNTNRTLGEESWQVVKSKERNKNKNKNKKSDAKPKMDKPKSKPSASPKSGNMKRRPPRTAAVTIKGTDEKFSYADALRTLRNKITLPDMNINVSHVRKAVGGGLIIEIPGEDKVKKAEELKNKITEVLGPTVKVSRPVIKGEVRLIGLDDSVIQEEVADVVATAGDCSASDIKVGMIRPMTNGLYTVWAQCPLGAAIKAAKPGKIKIGWTVAKIELLKAKPVQCYRCWRKGHLKAQCKSPVDRSDTCYRCGNKGHLVNACDQEVACAICREEGRNAQHRVGSAACKAEAVNYSTGGSKRIAEIPMPMEIVTEESERRSGSSDGING